MRNASEASQSGPAAAMHRLCNSLIAAEDKLPGLRGLVKLLKASPETAESVLEHFGVADLLLQEIVRTYVHLNSGSVKEISQTIFPSLEILIHLCPLKGFRALCVSSQLPLFLYPILNSPIRSEELEAIKTQGLTFIKLLIQEESTSSGSVEFFKNTELVPLCLRNMEIGSERSKVAAASVFYSIICTKEGLEYACQTYDRFMATSMILNAVLVQMESLQSPGLLELVIKIYTKLCDMPNAKIVFSKNRPQMLYAERIREMVRNHPSVKAAYEEFLSALQS